MRCLIESITAKTPYGISRLDGAQHQSCKPEVIWPKVGDDLVVPAGPELISNPPRQSVDYVGELGVRDSAEPGFVRGCGYGPHSVYAIRFPTSQSVHHVRQQVTLSYEILAYIKTTNLTDS